MKILTLCLCVAAASSACLAQGGADKPLAQVVKGNNEFMVDVYKKLAAKDGNIFFSPTSIHTALAMTCAGAAGQTAAEMEKALHLDASREKTLAAFAELMKSVNDPGLVGGKPPYQLVMANALWGQKGYPFKADYKQTIGKNFQASFSELDFKQPEPARATINDWVARQTKDKIKDLIPQGVLGEKTRLVLTNAIYFKSNWGQEFNKDSTRDLPFALSANKKVDAPMMNQEHRMGYMEDDEIQAIDLPYNMQALSMVIVLPRKVDGLAAVEKGLTAQRLQKVFKDMKHVPVNVTMPRFTFSSQFSMADMLKELGMALAFDPDKADFSGMADPGGENLFLYAVLHKAFVAVDEKGTEAAAATAIMVGATAMPVPQEPKIFKADHPFIFLIRHNQTGEILFAGRLADPKAK